VPFLRGIRFSEEQGITGLKAGHGPQRGGPRKSLKHSRALANLSYSPFLRLLFALYARSLPVSRPVDGATWPLREIVLIDLFRLPPPLTHVVPKLTDQFLLLRIEAVVEPLVTTYFEPRTTLRLLAAFAAGHHGLKPQVRTHLPPAARHVPIDDAAWQG
jgi:hypothetical protein